MVVGGELIAVSDTGLKNDAPCVKNGRYSLSARRNSCGAIVCWSISTFE